LRRGGIAGTQGHNSLLNLRGDHLARAAPSGERVDDDQRLGLVAASGSGAGAGALDELVVVLLAV
jgi:hypothetical protein